MQTADGNNSSKYVEKVPSSGGARIVVRNHSYKQLAGKVLGDADALMAPIHSRSAAGNLHVRAGLQK